MNLKGKIWKMGDNINTDMIISGKYLTSSDPIYLRDHCFEEVEKGWAKKIQKGDFLLAGKNFGCGSSREHAPMALKAAGISCIIAESCGSIFYRNSINLGVPAIEIAGIVNKFEQGDLADIDLKYGNLENLTSNTMFRFSPMTPLVLDIISSGGLLSFIAKNR